jgi:DNA-binding LacI/PurR family transcriptional regulator
MRDKTTLREIAAAANVSVATASRALNGTGRVRPEILNKVRAAVARLQSMPPYYGKTQTICFLLANRSMLHPFHASVLMGAQEFAFERQNHILFYPFQYSADVPADQLRLPLLFERRGAVDGYIVGGMNSENLLELLTRMNVPFAVLGNNVLGRWKPDRYDVVWMDDGTGAYELTQYLQSLGHAAIWFVGSPRFPTSTLLKGYSRAMAEMGLQPLSVENDSENERDAGYLAAKSIFAKGLPVTAIFAYNDMVAQGAFEAAEGCGLRIPDEITIVGFGDRPEARALNPALTTVWAYPDQVGRRLAELVLNRVENPGEPPRKIVLPTRLMKRNSCARVVHPESATRKLSRYVFEHSS